MVIHDDPLTLCLAPFKLQIVLHTLFRTRKDHIVPFDVLGLHYLFKHVQLTSARTDIGLLDRDGT